MLESKRPNIIIIMASTILELIGQMIGLISSQRLA